MIFQPASAGLTWRCVRNGSFGVTPVQRGDEARAGRWKDPCTHLAIPVNALVIPVASCTVVPGLTAVIPESIPAILASLVAPCIYRLELLKDLKAVRGLDRRVLSFLPVVRDANTRPASSLG